MTLFNYKNDKKNGLSISLFILKILFTFDGLQFKKFEL
jgi:hypothetical protein